MDALQKTLRALLRSSRHPNRVSGLGKRASELSSRADFSVARLWRNSLRLSSWCRSLWPPVFWLHLWNPSPQLGKFCQTLVIGKPTASSLPPPLQGLWFPSCVPLTCVWPQLAHSQVSPAHPAHALLTPAPPTAVWRTLPSSILSTCCKSRGPVAAGTVGSWEVFQKLVVRAPSYWLRLSETWGW